MKFGNDRMASKSGGGFIKTRNVPGPGNYTFRSTFDNIQGAGSFGKSLRDSMDAVSRKKEEPGPSSYCFKDTDAIKTQAPKFGFGSASRDKGSFVKKAD
jgi:hypothetical protein